MSETRPGLEGEINDPNAENKQEKDRPIEQEQPRDEGDEIKEDESGFDERFRELEERREKIRHEQRKAIALSTLMREGGQTLINEFGSEKLFDAIKQAKEQNVGIPTTFEIIKQLEPDQKKRVALYSKMESDADSDLQEYEVWEQNPGEDERKYHYYGERHAGNTNGTKVAVVAFRSLDTRLGKLLSNSRMFLEAHAQGVEHLTSLGEVGLDQLRGRLSAHEDKLYRLIAEIGFSTDEDREQLGEDGNKLYGEISREIERVEHEIRLQFEEWRAGVLADLETASKLDSKTGEVSEAIKDAVQKVEGEVQQRVDGFDAELSEKTKDLQELLEATAGLHKFY